MKYNDSQPYFVIQEGGGKKFKAGDKEGDEKVRKKKRTTDIQTEGCGGFVVEITMENGSDEMRWMSRGG